MKRYGWTPGLYGARRLDGLEVSPPLEGGMPSFWLIIRRPDEFSEQLPINVLTLEAACELVDERYPLPEWWRQFVPEASEL